MPRFFLHPEITFFAFAWKKIAFRSRASLQEQIQIEAVNSWRCAQQVATKVTLCLLSPQHARQMVHLHLLSLLKNTP